MYLRVEDGFPFPSAILWFSLLLSVRPFRRSTLCKIAKTIGMRMVHDTPSTSGTCSMSSLARWPADRELYIVFNLARLRLGLRTPRRGRTLYVSVYRYRFCLCSAAVYMCIVCYYYKYVLSMMSSRLRHSRVFVVRRIGLREWRLSAIRGVAVNLIIACFMFYYY